MKTILITIVALFALYGCSNRQAYDSLQGAKRNDCNKIIDNNERARCLEEANKRYDQYQKERDELKRS